MTILPPTPASGTLPAVPALAPVPMPLGPPPPQTSPRAAAGDDDEEDDLGDEEDLSVSQPPVEEDSGFEDFDDEFDDDFEEEENDPDWDHPDDAEPDGPAPPKGTGRKK